MKQHFDCVATGKGERGAEASVLCQSPAENIDLAKLGQGSEEKEREKHRPHSAVTAKSIHLRRSINVLSWLDLRSPGHFPAIFFPPPVLASPRKRKREKKIGKKYIYGAGRGFPRDSEYMYAPSHTISTRLLNLALRSFPFACRFLLCRILTVIPLLIHSRSS